MVAGTVRRRSCLKSLAVSLGLMLAAMLLLGFALFANQKIANRRVREDFPAPGRLFSVQGHEMHLNCSGHRHSENSPVILIDAGNASYSLDWWEIQHSLEPAFRVCTYDRPGYGWSEVNGNPRHALHATEELHSLLEIAGEMSPYLLLGHSLGGLHMQLFALTYRDEVVGLILVESPGAKLDTGSFLKTSQMTLSSHRAMRLLATSGLLRAIGPLLGDQTLPAGAEGLPEREREAYLLLLLDPQHYETAIAEMENLPLSLDQLASQSQGEFPFGDLPLVVLTSGMIDVPVGNNPFTSRRMPVEPGAIAQQAALAGLSISGVQQVVPASGHLMQHDAPEAIITVIRDLAQIRVQSAILSR
jgi:pimeloyl-ACP methyl ester carboxylesterase